MPEGGEQLLARFRRHRVFDVPDVADGRDRRTHLVEVDLAAIAEVDVLLEQARDLAREGALEVVGDQLDDLLAREMLSHRSVLPKPRGPVTAPGEGELVDWRQ